MLDAGVAGVVAGARPGGAVVNAEFFEVGQEGEGELDDPAVAAKLVGRAGVGADVDAAQLIRTSAASHL
jgi:hypothetical protein